jgi:hypothetical protein
MDEVEEINFDELDAASLKVYLVSRNVSEDTARILEGQ